MKKAVPVFLSMVLAACSYSRHTVRLSQMEGKPLSFAVGRLGAPEQEVRQGDARIYVWIHDEAWEAYAPEDGAGVAIVGKTVVYPETVRPFSKKTYTWECRLEISAEKGLVTEARYWGDAPACDYFRDRLKP
ncbi:MAG: hypothetical protein KGQ70_07695 [Alphaproteobacteria bacterium]|nr:hypothetical protein [Alphaproteobacteria bacterium]